MKPPLLTYVPDQEPIELIAYYKEFEWYYPKCEMATKHWFVRNIRKDWVIFDVGANIGYFSILFSRLATEGHVYAFEPTSTYEMLMENLAHHGAQNVTALRLAVGKQSGPQQDAIFRIWGEEPERQVYPFTTIDEFVEKQQLLKLDCIKIDVDSFDFEVLQGAKNTLIEYDPFVMVELNHALNKRNQSNAEALEWMADLGYKQSVVFDYDNFLFKRTSQFNQGKNDVPRLSLTFDQFSQIKKDINVQDLDKCPVHSGSGMGKQPVIMSLQDFKVSHGTLEGTGPLCITTAPEQWSYAASLKISHETLGFESRGTGTGFFRIYASVEKGRVGFLVVLNDLQTAINEVECETGKNTTCLDLFFPSLQDCAYLIVRNISDMGSPSKVLIQTIELHMTDDTTNSFIHDMLNVASEKEIRVIFDVGANRGDLTMEYLGAFPSALIHCFEPGPRQLEKLRERFNMYHNVHIHNYAVTDSCGSALFHCNRADPTDSLLPIVEDKAQRWVDGEGTGIELQSLMKVNTITLDEFCKNHGIDYIDILKFDIQGAEQLAIKGATGLLERHAVKMILAELMFVPVYEKQPYYYDICKMLARFDYRLVNLYQHRYDESSSQLKWADGLFIYRDWPDD